MNSKKFTVYFAIPLATSSILLACYVSGVRLLETIVSAPYMETVQRESRREFGLLENLQLALIVATLAILFRTAHKCEVLKVQRLLFFLSAGTVMLFLEEIDYGMHFYNFLMQVPIEDTVESRSLHNYPGAAHRMKQIYDTFTVGFFVVAPFMVGRIRNPNIRYLIPDRYSALTLLAGVITRNIAHAVDRSEMGFGLHGDVSEFRELITYYLIFLWVSQLARTGPLRKVAEEEFTEPV